MEAEIRQMELEEKLRRTEEEVWKAVQAHKETEKALKMMQEQVKTASSLRYVYIHNIYMYMYIIMYIIL